MLSLTYLDNIAQENIVCNVFSDVSTPRTTLHRLIKGVCVCAMLSLRDSRHHSTENNPLCNVVLILLEHCTGETLCNILKAPDKIAQEKTCSLLLSKILIAQVETLLQTTAQEKLICNAVFP